MAASAYSKSYALKLYVSLLLLAVFLEVGLNLIGLGGAASPLSVGLQLWIIWQTTTYLCGCCPCKKEISQLDVEEQLVESVAQAASVPTKSSSASRPERLYFLDNLKVFLTVMVILHHVICMFAGGGWVWGFNNYPPPKGPGHDDSYFNIAKNVGNWILGMNQMYFMCMFFFISGYFTPSSFKRKGKFAFLKDKFKRLGLPFLFVSWFFFPLCIASSIFMISDFGNDDILDIWYYSLVAQPGPLWFVGWLLVFNSVYASVDHSTGMTEMQCPSPLKLLCWSILLNCVQFAILATGISTFVYMPISVGSLPFDVFFFFGGCIAKNNKWFDTGTSGGFVEIMSKKWTRISVYLAFFAVAVAALVFNLFKPGATMSNIIFFISSTIGIALIFFVELDFFRRYLNKTGPISAMLAQTAYTAYIIHPIFVNLASYLFLKTYEESTGDHGIIWIGQNLTSTSEFTADNAQVWLMGGMFVAGVFACVTTFFCAYWVKKLPGLRDIL